MTLPQLPQPPEGGALGGCDRRALRFQQVRQLLIHVPLPHAQRLGHGMNEFVRGHALFIDQHVEQV